MISLTTVVKYKVPFGRYCNHAINKTALRCRFCVEHKKGIFICVLHNEPLLVEQGFVCYKASNCLKGADTNE